MNELKEKVLAAALGLVSNRIYMESREPSAYDDAQAKSDNEVFNDAVLDYVESLGYDLTHLPVR